MSALSINPLVLLAVPVPDHAVVFDTAMHADLLPAVIILSVDLISRTLMPVADLIVANVNFSVRVVFLVPAAPLIITPFLGKCSGCN